MKTRYILLLGAALATLSCAKEQLSPSIQPSEQDGAKVYTFTATVSDPLTKSFFKEDEAPSRYIYWEESDEFDFQDITISETDTSVVISSGKPTQLAADQRSVTFTRKAHDYMVITYPKGAVKMLNKTDIKTWISSRETNIDTLRGFTAVSVNVPKNQVLSSELTPANMPMATTRIALSEGAQAAVKEGKDTVSVAFEEGPVQFYPLAGLAKMTVTGLPELESAKIVKAIIQTEYQATSTATGTPQRGIRGENIFSIGPAKTLVGNWTSGDSRFDLVLESSEGVEYTAENGAVISFVADESSFGIKTMQVALYTADGGMYKKKFDMSKAAKQITFSKSRISSFSLDFTNGSVSKVSNTRFAVEWSSGYLVFDADNKGYKFAPENEIGLYFKFGSPVGVQFYASDAEYNDKMKPIDPKTGEYLTGSSTFTDDKQTLANGTDMFYSGILQGGARFYGENALWRGKPAYKPEGGVIVASRIEGSGQVGDEYNYHAIPGSIDFTGANDPCSYVKVASGEKAWRLPTEAEIQDLINVGAAGMEYGNFDGSDMKGSSAGGGKPCYVRFSDGQQTVTFKCSGSVSQTFSSAYTMIQMTYNNKYCPRFWSSTYVGTEAPATGSSNSGKAFNIGLGTTPSITTAPSITNYAANRKNNFTGEYQIWEAMAVRCVRSK